MKWSGQKRTAAVARRTDGAPFCVGDGKDWCRLQTRVGRRARWSTAARRRSRDSSASRSNDALVAVSIGPRRGPLRPADWRSGCDVVAMVI